jgi:hypothetical protein
MRIDSAIITGSFSVNGDTFNDLGVPDLSIIIIPVDM